VVDVEATALVKLEEDIEAIEPGAMEPWGWGNSWGWGGGFVNPKVHQGCELI
jgi:hypothetical protein